MHIVEEAYTFASQLYWIAYLLTGNEELSSRVTIDALGLENGLEWMSKPPTRALLRRTVINNTLLAIQVEMSMSAHRFAARQSDEGFIATAAWSVDGSISNVQVDNALLAIELFPRCALLLTVFEGLPPEEAGAILHCDCDLIKAGLVLALTELTRHLGSISAAAPCAEWEIEHEPQPMN